MVKHIHTFVQPEGSLMTKFLETSDGLREAAPRVINDKAGLDHIGMVVISQPANLHLPEGYIYELEWFRDRLTSGS